MVAKFIEKPTLVELPRIEDRATFLYVEHAKINRQDGAVLVMDKEGIVKIPAALLSVLLLGPGTDISHRAMELLGQVGTSVMWVGEGAVRYYAGGRALSGSTKLLEKQVELVSNTKSRLRVARKMYQMRFPEEDVAKLTMQQLRGREGARIRTLYRRLAKQYQIKWDGRDYRPDDYEASSPTNKALSAANFCLYGLTHSVISALGLSPGLGFIHTGHEKSFVYDLADLYKADFSIPLSFEISSIENNHPDIGNIVRKQMRQMMYEGRLLEKMVKDIQYLLEVKQDDQVEFETIHLWDDKGDLQRYGVNYSKET